MIEIDAAGLTSIMPYAGTRAFLFADPLRAAMAEFDIGTGQRQAAFIAQVAHESGSLKYTCEIASGEAYEGRVDLGNTQEGDGVRFKGRGLLQITGRANYRACGTALGLTLILHPEILEETGPACRSAAWFWQSRGLNELADADAFGAITKKINGGYTKLDERIAFWLRARSLLH